MEDRKRVISEACRECIVYNSKGGLLSGARVRVVNGEIHLWFKESGLKALRTVLPVDFFDSYKGRIRTFSELVIHRNPHFPKESEFWMADCRIVRVYEIIQRQKDIRVDMKAEQKFVLPDMTSFYGTIENISAGGFFVATPQMLNREDRIKLETTFLKNNWSLEAQLRWMRPQIYGQYGYGCMFQELPSEAEEQIRGLVYKLQMRQLRGE